MRVLLFLLIPSIVLCDNTEDHAPMSVTALPGEPGTIEWSGVDEFPEGGSALICTMIPGSASYFLVFSDFGFSLPGRNFHYESFK